MRIRKLINNRKLATASTIGSFFVASITGLLLFFEFGPGSVRATHEWISIFFVGAVALHIFVNLKPFVNYFKTSNIAPLLAALLLGAAIFVVAFNDIYAAEAVFQSALKAEFEAVVFLFDVNPAEAIDALKAAGIEVKGPPPSIADIAVANGLEVYDVLDPLFRLKDR